MTLHQSVLTLALATLPAIAAAAEDGLPVNDLKKGQPIRDWLVVGAFPNPDAAQPLPDGSPREGFGKDYLAAAGGEASPSLRQGAAVPFDGGVATARRITTDDGIVNLLPLFTPNSNVVAYGVTQVRAKKAEASLAFFGSDDWAKVWVNGELVHSITGPGGRGLVPRQDQFAVRLKKGLNTIVVKVEQGSGDWGFTLEVLTAAEAKAHEARQARVRLIRRAQDSGIGPVSRWGHIFSPGPLPEVVWEQPELIEAAFGKAPLTVRWFGPDLSEVTTAEKPGRYIACGEATLSDGRKIRRMKAFFCAPPEFDLWSPVRLSVPHLRNSGIDPAVWGDYAEWLGYTTAGMILDRLQGSEDGPIILGSLFGAKPVGRELTQLDYPDLRYQDDTLRVKMKLLGRETAAGLRPPRRKPGAPSTVLHEGTPAQADVAADATARIRAACQAWYDDARIPLTVLVARHGVIVIHEAIGSTPEGPVTVAMKLPLASLTKTHAGLLLAQFIDQGIISLDDPVGKYLPDFPTTGPKVLTIRHCVTHMSGLEGHGEWRGMMNPWLDNVIANGLETLSPGEAYLYNGMGFDLAGKVMEVVSGRSIFRLFHENFFQPLGQDNPTIEDLGYGITCTVKDLARTGQMMLNRGSYGETEFFSVNTFEEKVRPRPLGDFFPDMRGDKTQRYNLGMNYATDGGADNPILGRNTLMHGAATGAVLRVDYDHDLVVAVCRSAPGPRYDENLNRVLRAVAESLR